MARRPRKMAKRFIDGVGKSIFGVEHDSLHFVEPLSGLSILEAVDFLGVG